MIPKADIGKSLSIKVGEASLSPSLSLTPRQQSISYYPQGTSIFLRQSYHPTPSEYSIPLNKGMKISFVDKSGSPSCHCISPRFSLSSFSLSVSLLDSVMILHLCLSLYLVSISLRDCLAVFSDAKTSLRFSFGWVWVVSHPLTTFDSARSARGKFSRGHFVKSSGLI